MSALGRPRNVLAAMLLIATGLFAYAVIHERSLIHNGRGESAAQLTHEGAATKAGETPAKRANETAATNTSETPANRASEGAARSTSETPAKAGTVSETSTAHSETPTEHASEGRVLGVDLESTPLIVLAIVAGLALAILAASPLGGMRGILLALALGALAWSALDVREIVHLANESRTDLAIVAGLVAALHASAAALAVWLARKPPTAHRRTSQPTATA